MSSSKWVLGLTGGIGTGKTTVSNTFKKLGCRIIDADICARQIVEPGTYALNCIREHYGEKIISVDGSLNRCYLREIIFSSNLEKDFLNNLLHPLIRNKITVELNIQGSESYIVLVAPLLFENKLDDLTNRILCMDIDEETQIKRTMLRDGCNYDIAKNIVLSQLPRDIKLAKSDDVLVSNFPKPEDLEKHIVEIHKKYLLLSQNV